MQDLTNIKYANKNYKLICKKHPNINYKTRECSYVILIEDKDRIAIVNDGKYFFLGGGKEKEETEIQTIEREMLEETGYKIVNPKLFDRVISYEYNSSRGYLKIVASIYIAKLGNKICDPTEKDHKIMWGKINDFIPLMYHKYQKFILKELQELGEFYNVR